MDKKGNSPYSMVCTGGMFLMGRLEGGNKLLKPRVFTIEENGTRMRLQTLPSFPPFVNVRPDFSYYVPYHDVNLVALYERVTGKEAEEKETEAFKKMLGKPDSGPAPNPGGKVTMEP